MISCYADICAMRHPKEGAPLVAARYARIPVINAGDGGHQHPTQTLTDLMTIRQKTGRLDHLTIGLCGDLKFGRTVHSLIKSLARQEDIRFVPDFAGRTAPARLCAAGSASKTEAIPYKEVAHHGRSHAGARYPVYDTGAARALLQRRRLHPFKGYAISSTVKKLEAAKPGLAVLHPLPRVNEIAPEVDNDPRAAYFEQAQNGVYVRMALIMKLLGLHGPEAKQA